jgi:Acetyl-CoA carboxylase beta subunit
MLKLPLCPYCGARFLYPDVKSDRKNETKVCPNCNNKFKIDNKYRLVLFLCAFLLLIGVNCLLLRLSSMNLWYLLVVTGIGVAVTRLLIPFTVRYRKTGQSVQQAQTKKRK